MKFIVLNSWQYFCRFFNEIHSFEQMTIFLKALWQNLNIQLFSTLAARKPSEFAMAMNSWRAAYWIRVNLSLPSSLTPLLILWSPAAQRVDMAYHWGWKWWMCSVPLAESCFMSKNRSYFIAKHSNYATHISGGLVLLKESNLKMMLRISWVVVLK